ncbi:MAG: CHAT domain-containing protein, partial [Saprospiraceae bacterium]
LKKKYYVEAAYDQYDNIELSYLYQGLGVHYRDFGQLDSTQYWFSKAKELLEQCHSCLPEKEVLAWVNLTDHLSHFHFITGHLERSLNLIKTTINMVVEQFGENHEFLIPLYLQLGHNYLNYSEIKLANTYFEKSVLLYHLDTIKANEQFWDYTHALFALSDNYLALEQPERALEFLQKLLKLEDRFKDIPTFKMTVLMRLGLFHLQKKEYSQSYQYLLAAENEYQEKWVDVPLNPFHLYYRNSVLDSKKQYYLARKEWEKAKVINYDLMKHQMNSNLDWNDAFTYHSQADIFMHQQQADSAFYYNQLALAALATNPQLAALPKVEDLPSINLVYDVFTQRTRILQKIYAEEKDTKKYYERVLSITDLMDKFHTESIRKLNLFRATQSKNLIRQSILPYKFGINAACESAKLFDDPTKIDTAFYYAQKMKAQQLWIAAMTNDAKSFNHLSAELQTQERDLITDINFYENKIRQAYLEKDSIAAKDLELNQLLKRKRKYAELVREMEVNHPKYYASKYNFTPETATTLQPLLQTDELLIEYVLADSVLFVFILDATSKLHLQKVPLRENTTNNIEQLHQLLQSSPLLRPKKRQKFIALSFQLYQQFIQPIVEQLSDKNRLIIVGDDITSYLPFEILVNTKQELPLHQLPYLVRDYEISYHYSSTLFAAARKKEAERQQGIYAFAPIYDTNNQIAEATTSIFDESTNSTLRAFNPDGTYAPLPESEREVAQIGQLFNPQNTTIQLRAAATESNLKTQLEQPFRYIHIAGHSFADLTNPKFSGIACFSTTADDNKQDDGTLFAGEIYNLNIQADLITLSSCESGFGKLENSEGLLGLNRAFVYAGTSNVVFSLWKVYDKVSAKLMIDFYQQLLKNNDYASSLRQAKLNLINNEATASPHFWSSYLLIGR